MTQLTTRQTEIAEGRSELPERKVLRYRELWESQGYAVPAIIATPPRTQQKARKTADGKPGTELTKSLAWIEKIKPETATCKCKNLAREMDTDGVKECRRRRDSYYLPKMLKNKTAITDAMRAEGGLIGVVGLVGGLVPDVIALPWLRSKFDAACEASEKQTLRQKVARPKLRSKTVVWPDSPPPVVTVIPAIRTAYRDRPTLTKTIDSLRTAGFERPRVFSEPDAPANDCEVARWETQQKPFLSFFKMCKWLLENESHDWLLLCEDDVEFRAGAADLIRTYSMDESIVLSLYVSKSQQVKLTTKDGFAAVTGDLHGSLAYLIHRSAIVKLLESKAFTEWTLPDRVDRVFSQAVNEIGCSLVTHNPSLAQHTGATSTITKSRTLNGSRLSNFVSERHKSELVTLVTPTGDRPEAFALVERWIANQRYSGPVEWIVVDDGHVPTQVTQGQTYIRSKPTPAIEHTLCKNLRTALPHISGQMILVIEDDEYYGPDYLSTMVGQLQHADLVGERASKYYFPQQRKWFQYPAWHHVALCRMGFTADVLPTLKNAIKNTDHRSVDLRVWNSWKGSRKVWTDAVGNMRLGVGIKGMPGRACGVVNPPRTASDDASGEKLRQMVGDDAEPYLEMIT